jgi:hypothetical protein
MNPLTRLAHASGDFRHPVSGTLPSVLTELRNIRPWKAGKGRTLDHNEDSR